MPCACIVGQGRNRCESCSVLKSNVLGAWFLVVKLRTKFPSCQESPDHGCLVLCGSFRVPLFRLVPFVWCSALTSSLPFPSPGDSPLRLALKKGFVHLPLALVCLRPLACAVWYLWRLRWWPCRELLGWEFRVLLRLRRLRAARNTKPSSSTQVRRRRTEDSRRKRLASLTTEGTSMEGNVYPDACQTSRADSTKIRSATFCPTRRRARTPTRTTAAQ